MFFPYFYLLMFYQCGTVFQTAFLTTCYNPETSSRVTLAALGIGFQPNLPTKNYTTRLINNYTTIQQDNKPVWKTVPSAARVTPH